MACSCKVVLKIADIVPFRNTYKGLLCLFHHPPPLCFTRLCKSKVSNPLTFTVFAIQACIAFHLSGQYICAVFSSWHLIKALPSLSLLGNDLMLNDMLGSVNTALNSVMALAVSCSLVYCFASSSTLTRLQKQITLEPRPNV